MGYEAQETGHTVSIDREKKTNQPSGPTIAKAKESIRNRNELKIEGLLTVPQCVPRMLVFVLCMVQSAKGINTITPKQIMQLKVCIVK